MVMFLPLSSIRITRQISGKSEQKSGLWLGDILHLLLVWEENTDDYGQN